MATAIDSRKKILIGTWMVERGLITDEQQLFALAEQKKTGKRLGSILIDLDYIKEIDFIDFLARQLNIPFLDIARYPRTPEIVKMLPETLARRFRVLLLENNVDDALLAMADPTDLMAQDELSRVLKKPIRVAVVIKSELLTAIDQSYRRTSEIDVLAEKLGAELSENYLNIDALLISDEIADAPVVKLLQSLFEDAIQAKASDIHIEPDESVLRIRQRVDGVLIEHILDEVNIASALVIRLKLIAGLNISEKRVPQDGRFNIRVQGRTLDVRISTLPIQHGESVVMRLLDHSEGLLDLYKLGIPTGILARFRRYINNPQGLILVTGPTGSGKTTTLYAALSEVNKPEIKIITAEDPVEYSLPRINQVQINEKIGLTFSNVLRSALRQDPDIILVGEIRDTETAQIAIRASITGHLVLSTLHTKGAIETATRLLDMGIEGYILASALQVIIAQRLVRKICQYCIEPIALEPGQLIWLEASQKKSYAQVGFKQGRGCQQCNYTGYRGRMGIYELLDLKAETLNALRRNDAIGFATAALQTPGFIRLSTCAAEYAEQGITTVNEVLRVTGSGE
ncbi:MAG: GspE/PulE family protein [Methylococcaceae bacterium]